MIDFLRYAAIVLGVGFLPGVWLGTLFADELKVLWRKVFPGDTGRHVSGPASTTLLGPAEIAGHASALREAAEPFLPPSPAGEHPYPPYVPAWRPAVRKQTQDHAPWTGSQPALTAGDEAAYEAERRRVDLVRSQLPDHPEDVTREDMERALASLRALPVADVPEAGRLA